MFLSFRTEAAASLLAVLLLFACAGAAAAQDDELGDDAADPIKLFERGQAEHAKQNYEQALELYEEALRLRPEFPEAAYQRAGALVATGRLKEAEEALRRAVALDPQHLSATAALAELRARAGDSAEAVSLWRRATALKDQDATLWLARARAERAARDLPSAVRSYERALTLEPSSAAARLGRAATLVESGEAERALADLRALEEAARSDARLALDLANVYGLADRAEDARRVYDRLPDAARNSEEGRKLYAALNARCDETPEAFAALEKLVERDPRNASALACLGSLTRASDPQRSLEYYRRANALDPSRADYAVGFAAALVQLRRFAEAAALLRRVVGLEPDNYAARANLAAALYGQKLYKDAILEYKWVSRARPDLAVTHFFIGTAHDHLGEYTDALAAYEAFVARADPRTNQLEIDKVNLRLPSLRNQIKRGEGAKPRGKAQR